MARKGEHYWDWAACGTPAQYRQHLRLGIPACRDCTQAELRRGADYRRRRKLGLIVPRPRRQWKPLPIVLVNGVEYPRPKRQSRRRLQVVPQDSSAEWLTAFNRMITEVNDNLNRRAA